MRASVRVPRSTARRRPANAAASSGECTTTSCPAATAATAARAGDSRSVMPRMRIESV